MAIHTRLIKINDLYLTGDGLETGIRLLTDVEGLSVLRPANVSNVSLPISGDPFEFVRPNEGAGAPIKIKTLRGMPFDMLTDVLSEIDTSASGNSDIVIEFSDGPDDMTLNCRGGAPGVKPVEYPGGFLTDIELDVVLNFTVRSFA